MTPAGCDKHPAGVRRLVVAASHGDVASWFRRLDGRCEVGESLGTGFADGDANRGLGREFELAPVLEPALVRS